MGIQDCHVESGSETYLMNLDLKGTMRRDVERTFSATNVRQDSGVLQIRYIGRFGDW